MKILQETTDWAVPNHTYFVSDSKDKVYAYVKRSGIKVEEFSKPIKFSVSGRRFKEVTNTWNYSPQEQVEVTVGKQYRVPGSTGTIYTVTNDHGSWTCTCPASKWQKGQCKHIQSLAGK